MTWRLAEQKSYNEGSQGEATLKLVGGGAEWADPTPTMQWLIRGREIDISIMAEWGDFMDLSLKVITSGTTIIQQWIPCSPHKHVGEAHRLRHLKVGILEWPGEAGLGKDRNRSHRGSGRSGYTPHSAARRGPRGRGSILAWVAIYIATKLRGKNKATCKYPLLPTHLLFTHHSRTQ